MKLIRDNKWWMLYTNILANLLPEWVSPKESLFEYVADLADRAWLHARKLPDTEERQDDETKKDPSDTVSQDEVTGVNAIERVLKKDHPRKWIKGCDCDMCRYNQW